MFLPAGLLDGSAEQHIDMSAWLGAVPGSEMALSRHHSLLTSIWLWGAERKQFWILLFRKSWATAAVSFIDLGLSGLLEHQCHSARVSAGSWRVSPQNTSI